MSLVDLWIGGGLIHTLSRSNLYYIFSYNNITTILTTYSLKLFFYLTAWPYAATLWLTAKCSETLGFTLSRVNIPQTQWTLPPRSVSRQDCKSINFTERHHHMHVKESIKECGSLENGSLSETSWCISNQAPRSLHVPSAVSLLSNSRHLPKTSMLTVFFF